MELNLESSLVVDCTQELDRGREFTVRIPRICIQGRNTALWLSVRREDQDVYFWLRIGKPGAEIDVQCTSPEVMGGFEELDATLANLNWCFQCGSVLTVGILCKRCTDESYFLSDEFCCAWCNSSVEGCSVRMCSKHVAHAHCQRRYGSCICTM